MMATCLKFIPMFVVAAFFFFRGKFVDILEFLRIHLKRIQNVNVLCLRKKTFAHWKK